MLLQCKQQRMLQQLLLQCKLKWTGSSLFLFKSLHFVHAAARRSTSCIIQLCMDSADSPYSTAGTDISITSMLASAQSLYDSTFDTHDSTQSTAVGSMGVTPSMRVPPMLVIGVLGVLSCVTKPFV